MKKNCVMVFTSLILDFILTLWVHITYFKSNFYSLRDFLPSDNTSLRLSNLCGTLSNTKKLHEI